MYKVIGKERRTGVYEGRAYDNTILHTTYTKEGAEGVVCLTFQISSHGTGAGIGDPAHCSAAFGRIKPQIRFGPQFFVPGAQKPVFVLLIGKSFIVGTVGRQLHDDVGRDRTGGNLFVIGISHTGNVPRDLSFLKRFGKRGEIVPVEIRDLLRIAAAEDGVTPGAVTGRHAVIGHQIEKGTAVGKAPAHFAPAVLNAPDGGGLSGQQCFRIFEDLFFELHIAEADVAVVIVGVAQFDFGVPPSVVFVEGEVFRMALAEAFHQSQVTQSMAVGDVHGAGAQLKINLITPVFGGAGIDELLPLHDGFPGGEVKGAVLHIGTVRQVDLGQGDAFFAGDDGASPGK